MRLKLPLLTTILSFATIVWGQKSLTVFNLPLPYAESPNGDILKNSKKNKSTQLWIVYSDRNNNKVYEEPDSSHTAITTANFLDKFYVTGETGDFLELYKWEEGVKLEDVKKMNQLNPEKAHRVGWIKKENLLLWTKCLENKSNHYPTKGFIVLDKKSLSNPITTTGLDQINIFNLPPAQKGGYNVKPFMLSYVYKRSDNKLLIGKVIKSNVYRVEKEITGWIDESQFQFWEGYMYLEPNMEAKAVLERKSAGINAASFSEKDEARQWHEGNKKPAQGLSGNDPVDNSEPDNMQRYPVLGVEDDLVKTGLLQPLFRQENTEKIETNLQRGLFSDSFINPVIRNYLTKSRDALKANTIIGKFKTVNQIFFIPAWTTISVKGLNQPVFKRGIYISEDELQYLIKKYGSLLLDQRLAITRKNLYAAFEAIALPYFDEDGQSFKSQKNTLTLDAILSKVSGLPARSPILKQILIGDLKDADKVSSDQIDQLQTLLRNCIENLKNVTKDLNRSMRDATDNGVYYWIPEDYLP